MSSSSIATAAAPLSTMRTSSPNTLASWPTSMIPHRVQGTAHGVGQNGIAWVFLTRHLRYTSDKRERRSLLVAGSSGLQRWHPEGRSREVDGSHGGLARTLTHKKKTTVIRPDGGGSVRRWVKTGWLMTEYSYKDNHGKYYGGTVLCKLYKSPCGPPGPGGGASSPAFAWSATQQDDTTTTLRGGAGGRGLPPTESSPVLVPVPGEVRALNQRLLIGGDAPASPAPPPSSGRSGPAGGGQQAAVHGPGSHGNGVAASFADMSHEWLTSSAYGDWTGLSPMIPFHPARPAAAWPPTTTGIVSLDQRRGEGEQQQLEPAAEGNSQRALLEIERFLMEDDDADADAFLIPPGENMDTDLGAYLHLLGEGSSVLLNSGTDGDAADHGHHAPASKSIWCTTAAPPFSGHSDVDGNYFHRPATDSSLQAASSTNTTTLRGEPPQLSPGALLMEDDDEVPLQVLLQDAEGEDMDTGWRRHWQGADDAGTTWF